MCTVANSTDDPFLGNGNNGGSDNPRDTKASCTIQLADVGGPTQASLLDVCSYPSKQPNSDPSDCIVVRTDKGHLTIIKDVSPDAPTTNWNFNVTGPTVFSSSLTGDASSGVNNVDLGIYSITESAGNNTSLTGYTTTWSCVKNGTVTTSGSGTTISNLQISKDGNTEDSVVCTYTNSISTGNIIVDKVTNPSGELQSFNFVTGGGIYSNFSLTDAATPNNQSLISGIYSVSETPVTGWSTTSSCISSIGDTETISNLELDPIEIITCTFTNTKLNPSLNVVKSSTATSITVAGQVVPYAFTVTNTGNQTLTGITVTDPKCDATPSYVSGDTNADTKLDLTETWVYSCSRTVTQAEVNAGGNLTNTVTADSIESASDTDTLNIPVSQTPLMTVEKSSATTSLSAPATVTYSYLVTNTGNVTLTGISLSDDNDKDDLSCPFTTLTPSASMTCFATHTFNQDELNAGGSVDNIVTASSNEAPDVTDNLSIPIIQNPSLSVAKVADVTSVDAAGDIIGYTVTVTNTGNVSLTGVSVSDPLLSNLDCDGTVDSLFVTTGLTINVGQTLTCVGTYTVTQTDVDNYGGGDGDIDNTVTVESIQVVPSTASETVKVNGSITITKVDNLNSGQDFMFNYTPLGSTISQFTLDDDNNSDSTYLDSKTYSDLTSTFYDINEDEVTGWTPSIVECTTNYPSFTVQNTLSYGTMSVALRQGEKLNCIFTNTRDTGTITINKLIDPSTDGGKFDLKIDRTVYKTDAGNGDSTETITLPTASYTVSEVAGTNTDLSDYDTSVDCIDQQTGLSVVAGPRNGMTSVITDVISKDHNIVCTFTNTKKGSITGMKWNDLDGDGVLDAGEPGIGTVGGSPRYRLYYDTGAGWNWLVDGPFYPNGTYEPISIDPGTYYFAEYSVPAGWIQTYPGIGAQVDPWGWGHRFSDPIVVTAGSTHTANVGNFQLVEISGQKFSDLNGNGVKDTGESGIAEWTINLDKDADGSVDATTSTDENGNYSFSNLGPGIYRVREVGQTGWAQTTSNPTDIAAVSGQNITGVDFGNQIRGSITIIKDAVPNAAQNFTFTSPQPGSFSLDDDSNPALSNTKVFSSLGSNTYTISENTVSGWKLTDLVCTGDDNSSVDVNTRTATVTIDNPGENVTCTFTNTKYGSIAGRKYDDLNGNGTLDSGEQYLDDWTVKLFDSSMNELSSMVTGSGSLEQGQYKFTNLLPGSYYTCEVPQTGWVQTAPSTGQDYLGGHCRKRTVAGSPLTGVSFGNFKLAKIVVHKNVLGTDGISDPVDDTSFTGYLDGTDAKTISENTTTSYESLTPGTYTITEGTTPAGYSPVSISDGGVVNVTSGGIHDVYVVNKQNSANLTVIKTVVNDNGGQKEASDFAMNVSGINVSNASFPGNENGTTITLDAGTYSVDETEITGYAKSLGNDCSGEISFGESKTCTITNDDVAPKLTVTKVVENAGGSNSVISDFPLYVNSEQVDSGVQNIFNAGAYTIAEDNQDGFTAAISGDCDLDGIVNLNVGDIKSCTVTNIRDTGSVKVTKYNDLNGNGVKDAGEPILSGWEINLTGNESETTGDDGSTTFSNVQTGEYVLSETVQNGWTQTNISCNSQEEPNPEPSSSNLCHKTKSESHPWTAISVPANNHAHVGHGEDYPYVGPTNKQGHPDNTGEAWCALNISVRDDNILTRLINSIVGTVYAFEATVRSIVIDKDNNYPVSVVKDTLTECEIGNQRVDPRLLISKSNNASSDKNPGDSVTYTIVVKALDNTSHNVNLVDLLPKGFTYRSGSWTANITGGTFDHTITEPTYASPGTWDLGNLTEGSEVTLTLIADISSDQNPGTYKDLALAYGCKDEKTCSDVIASAVTPGIVDDAFVGTEVEVVKDQTNGGDYNVENKVEGQVLGASTSLPATGASPIWLMVAFICLVYGTRLIKSGNKSK